MLSTVHDLQWHVIYTLPRGEKKVASQISGLGIESYLPLHKVVRQWSDRKKKVEVPLFPNYVFVKVNEQKRLILYSIREVVRFVSIEKRPVVIRENEIDAIKKVLNGTVDVTAEEYFHEGMSVRITSGQFAGLEGVIIKRNSSNRMIVRVDGLMKAFSFNIASCNIESFSSCGV